MTETKYVYYFDEGNKDMKPLLGSKGANLAEMYNLSLPVPPGFTVTTVACNNYYLTNESLSHEVITQIKDMVIKLELETNKNFGGKTKPLLLSIRSGARDSMPGMMDTILNLGLNDTTVEILAETTNNKRFAYDSYRRFIQMFAEVAMGVDKKYFEEILEQVKIKNNYSSDIELTTFDLAYIIKKYKEIYIRILNTAFPTEAMDQLLIAVGAIFKSWNTPRAISYRRLNNIPNEWGTAANIQMMVFGNTGLNSCSGVAFSRSPVNGDDVLFGEYLINAQGEDVVSGIRTPLDISELKNQMSECYEDFYKYAKILEKHYGEMQDMEFTIEDNKLYILQTRKGKRTALAAIKIAYDLVQEKVINISDALLSVDANQLERLLHPVLDPNILAKTKVIATGLAASPGAGSGQIYFTAESAKEAHEEGKDVILVRQITSPEDIDGMTIAKGILTSRGGMTCHAAVVARGMGISCICGCQKLKVLNNSCLIDGITYNEGDFISIDGTTGFVYGEKIKTVIPAISGHFETFMKWADDTRFLEVRANAETVSDIIHAFNYGAEGIGLCRSEHMFFDVDKIFLIRKMIVTNDISVRNEAIKELLPVQRKDYINLYKVTKEHTLTIRLLDPPLHEFLPATESEIIDFANKLNMDVLVIKDVIEELKEINPMMGLRGCRLSIAFPEITKMQVRAIIEAAVYVSDSLDVIIKPEIMIPLVSDLRELKYIKKLIIKEIANVLDELDTEIEYKIGTMIELPRAAIIAGELATEVDFFSFGTNDLTQMTYGFSRDDASKFLDSYFDTKIFDFDPFVILDRVGVGSLVRNACEFGHESNNELELGVCGEHGGEPSSIEFFHNTKLNYVSCSPFRVPVARLAAAQAQILNPREK